MPPLKSVKGTNAAFSPSYFPVAIFVGGTAGIGRATAEAFARYTKGNAHIILVGRNRAAAEEIIASFPKPPPGSRNAAGERPRGEFVQCDATLMKNVHETTSSLLTYLPKLNFLVLSPGILSYRGPNETEEGIDKDMALNYYARWKFTYELIPLLNNARAAGEDAKVMSVLAAGSGGSIDLDDLGLKKRYTASKMMSTVPTYTDLMIKSFAALYPGIAFTHVYPGWVRTGIFTASYKSLRLLSPLVTSVLYPFSVSPSECAENMFWSLMAGKQGAFRRDPKGDEIAVEGDGLSKEAEKKLWDHTAQVTGMAQ